MHQIMGLWPHPILIYPPPLTTKWMGTKLSIYLLCGFGGWTEKRGHEEAVAWFGESNV